MKFLHIPAVITSALMYTLPTYAQDLSNEWVSVFEHKDSSSSLKVQIVTHPKGLMVQFANQGKNLIHFQFGFKTIQDEDSQYKNGRIHISPGMQSGKLFIPMPAQSLVTAPATLQVFNVRIGNPDRGSFVSM